MADLGNRAALKAKFETDDPLDEAAFIDFVDSLALKSEVDSAVSSISAKANAANAALTGVPTAPTATLGTNTTQLATTAFTRAEIAALVASAPAVLDTLDEIAQALGDDANFATTQASAWSAQAVTNAKVVSNTKNLRSYGTLTSNAEFKTAMIAALADLVSGDTFYIPILDYQIDIELVISGKTNVSVITDGAIIRQTGVDRATWKLLQCTNSKIENFQLYGKATETPWSGAGVSWNGVAGILIDECVNTEVTNNRLYNHAGGGIRWSSGITGLRVTRNYVEGVGGHVIQDNGSDVAIGSTGNNNFVGSHGLFNTNISISQNEVTKHCFGIGAASQPGANLSSNITIANNKIYNIQGQHGIYESDGNLVNVHHNEIFNTALIAIKLQNEQAVSRLRVCDNFVDSCGQGLAVGSLGTYITTSVTVDNNDITRIGTSGGDGDGVYVIRCREAKVNNNRISDVERYGIGGFGIAGSASSNTIRRSKHAGLLLNLLGDFTTKNNTIQDAIQYVGAGAAGRYAYVEGSVASTPDTATPLWTSIEDKLETTLADQAGFLHAILTQASVKTDIKDLSNGTSKTWRFTDIPQHLSYHNAPSATFYDPLIRDPAAVIGGRGRKIWYSTVSPQAGTQFSEIGDYCHNVNYTFTTLGDGYYSGDILLGWVCTYAGSPGLWQGHFADNRSTVSVAVDTTVEIGHSTIRVDATGAARTLTLLPAANCKGKIFTIKKIDSSGNTVTIDANASETIDGATTRVLSTQYASVKIQSNGTGWDVL